MHGIQIWHSRGAQSYALELHGSVVTCLCFKAACDRHVGDLISCHLTIEEAISSAKELKDALALAHALYRAALLGYFERDPAEVERRASDLIELSARHNFSYWLTQGRILCDWAPSASGDTAEGILLIEQGIKRRSRIRYGAWRARSPARKAESFALSGSFKPHTVLLHRRPPVGSEP